MMTDMTKIKTAVVVFSGGQDSTTCLLDALNRYDEVHCVTFDYQQRHKQEIDIAVKIAASLNIAAHKIIDVGVLGELAISALTRDNIAVSHALQENGLPNSFVPGRNILFLTLASIYAYQVSADTLITGVCETDFSGYPDCRNDFVTAMQAALELGLDKKLRIETPLMWLNKAQTWALADKLGKLDFIRNETLTCYNGIVGDGCADCPACKLRQAGLDQYSENKKAILASLEN